MKLPWPILRKSDKDKGILNRKQKEREINIKILVIRRNVNGQNSTVEE